MGRQVILIVDDEILIRIMLSDMLHDAGYGVIEATTGDEAFSILAMGQDYDLMITDVRMPGQIDGFELMSRSKGMHPSRPVVVSSGHLLPHEAQSADAFLPKPYVESVLLSIVERLIGPPCQQKSEIRNAS